MNTTHRSYADLMKMPVVYRGENAVGQFSFANGSPLISDVYNTLPEAVARFGSRIETGDKQMIFSGPWQAGQKDSLAKKAYSPRQGANQQEKLEYGLGFIRGLLTLAAPVVVTPKPVVVPPPVPVLGQIVETAPEPPPEEPVVPPAPAPKKRGRTKKK